MTRTELELIRRVLGDVEWSQSMFDYNICIVCDKKQYMRGHNLEGDHAPDCPLKKALDILDRELVLPTCGRCMDKKKIQIPDLVKNPKALPGGATLLVPCPSCTGTNERKVK